VALTCATDRVLDGPGRATGERLCRLRGRLTPRRTGSSAQPLPDPHSGYDDPPERTKKLPADDLEDGPKSLLTNKEDSIWRADENPLIGARHRPDADRRQHGSASLVADRGRAGRSADKPVERFGEVRGGEVRWAFSRGWCPDGRHAFGHQKRELLTPVGQPACPPAVIAAAGAISEAPGERLRSSSDPRCRPRRRLPRRWGRTSGRREWCRTSRA
jgi:hypothetical protein